MTQKQLITANNAELEKHKQDILSLPMADDVKNGKYVWKKYEYTPAETIQVINPKSTLTYYKSDSFKVSSDDYNVNSVDISFFNGFTLAVVKYDQHIINDGYVTISGGNFEVVYDKTNAILTIKGITYSSSDSGTLNYNGIKTYEKEEKIGGLIGYTVSDSETAYPDGGEQDGFWWERVKEGLPITQMGFTKFTYGEFVLSTDSALDFKLTHNLGVKPKKVRIYTEDSLKGATDAIREVALMNRYTSYSGDGREYYFESGVIQSYSYPDQEGFSNFDTVVYPEYVTESIITFKTESYYLLARGKKYYWYALA